MLNEEEFLSNVEENGKDLKESVSPNEQDFLQEFIQRCSVAKIPFEEREIAENNKYFKINIPAGEGEKLVKHLGFEKIEGKRNAYLLTDLKRAAKPIKEFINKLEQEEAPLVPIRKNRRR